jgi:hypothetical protein
LPAWPHAPACELTEKSEPSGGTLDPSGGALDPSGAIVRGARTSDLVIRFAAHDLETGAARTSGAFSLTKDLPWRSPQNLLR